jgi:peptidyl-prolyl cis-trans isomerase SurA
MLAFLGVGGIGGRDRVLSAQGETEVISLNLPRVRWKAFAAAALAAVIVLAVPSSSRAQQVAVFVNGQPITSLDIEHRAKFIQMSSKKVPSRREVLDSLIDEILEITEAKRFGIDVPDSDVDKSYKSVADRMGVDEQKLTQILVGGGASEDTLKRRLRAQIAWTGLVRGRFKASLEIRDKDVEAQLQLHKTEEKDAVGYEYIMRPVVLIVARGSADAAYEARKRDAEALRARFVNCDEGISFARALPDVAVRDQVSKFSADLAQQLRDILNGTAVGHLTPPEQTAEGVQMFAVCEKKETKSDTPEMRQIRDQMLQQKFGAQAKRYLESLRRQGMIEYKQQEDK